MPWRDRNTPVERPRHDDDRGSAPFPLPVTEHEGESLRRLILRETAGLRHDLAEAHGHWDRLERESLNSIMKRLDRIERNFRQLAQGSTIPPGAGKVTSRVHVPTTAVSIVGAFLLAVICWLLQRAGFPLPFCG